MCSTFKWNRYFAQHKTGILKTLFESGRLSVSGAAPLLMELGTEYCLLTKMDVENGGPVFARLWSFSEIELEEALEEIIALIQQGADAMPALIVSIAFPHATFLPDGTKSSDPSLLQALFPGAIGVPHYFANGKNHAFAVPHAVHKVLQKHFHSVTYRPAQACIPATGGEANSIHVFFVDHQIRVAVYQHHQLQLVQQYSFGVPLDVVYYLLKMCTEFGLSQQETLLSVSGFIGAGSPLYKELHQYFLNIRFSDLDSVTIEDQPAPRYYFSSLFNLAQCAS